MLVAEASLQLRTGSIFVNVKFSEAKIRASLTHGLHHPTIPSFEWLTRDKNDDGADPFWWWACRRLRPGSRCHVYEVRPRIVTGVCRRGWMEEFGGGGAFAGVDGILVQLTRSHNANAFHHAIMFVRE